MVGSSLFINLEVSMQILVLVLFQSPLTSKKECNHLAKSMQAKFLKTYEKVLKVPRKEAINILSEERELKVLRKEAKNALLELAKDKYYRILIVEEGLVLVPLVGSAAYKSFKPDSDSGLTWPDGTEIEKIYEGPAPYGASEVLLELDVNGKISVDDAKAKAMIGQSTQQSLARAGVIEMDDEKVNQSESSSDSKFTVLEWVDGIARLVLILGLEDESAIARAAEAIADASISEHMRTSFKEAGAIKPLLQLLDHRSDAVRLAAVDALERLSIRLFINVPLSMSYPVYLLGMLFRLAWKRNHFDNISKK